MGKGKAQPYNATMKAVRERREAQLKKDRRNRFIIIGVVIAVIVLIGALVAWAMTSSKNEAAESKFVVSDAVNDAKGLTIGKDGPGKATPNVPVVDFFFDYSCAHCVDFEHRVGKQVFEDVKAGKYTLVLRPVLTEALAYQYPATELAVRVFQDQPEKFEALHLELNERMYEAMVARDYQKMLADPVASVRAIGEDVGIKAAILDSLSERASEQTLQDWSQAWVKSGLRPKGDYGTPMFAKDGKALEPKTLEDALTLFRGE